MKEAVANNLKRPYGIPQIKVFGELKILTRNGAGTGADGGTQVGMTKMSDMDCKTDIVKVGEHPLGFGLYLFNYKPELQSVWGTGRQFGVMAQEVEGVVPDAVNVGRDGFRRVDYASLGIGFAA